MRLSKEQKRLTVLGLTLLEAQYKSDVAKNLAKLNSLPDGKEKNIIQNTIEYLVELTNEINIIKEGLTK